MDKLIQNIYKFPLILDRFMDDKVFTSDDVMAFDFPWVENIEDRIDLDISVKRLLLDTLNDTGSIKLKMLNLRYDSEEAVIFQNDKVFLILRGHGHLTGIGGLNLSESEANRIQDEFAALIIQKLS